VYVFSNDESLIRRSLEIARRARDKGNHPFGALLAGPNFEILLEAENTVVTDQDVTGHAETNLIKMASKEYSADFLAGCSVYTSTEPCPMCAGAIFWGNIRRVVFGLSSQELYQIVGEEPTGAVLALPCRDVFRKGHRLIEVVGPVLEEDAAGVHQGFWKAL